MKVRIKTWEVMKQEFGLEPEGTINCRCLFTEDMEKGLPSDRVIDIVRVLGDVYGWRAESSHGLRTWLISDDMIEEIVEETE